MYTAVSLVQARNSANAEQVGEAMKKHAEMGLEGRRHREEALRNQQQQQQQEQEQQQQRGSQYVARRQGSVGLSGDLETDAARQVMGRLLLSGWGW